MSRLGSFHARKIMMHFMVLSRVSIVLAMAPVGRVIWYVHALPMPAGRYCMVTVTASSKHSGHDGLERHEERWRRHGGDVSEVHVQCSAFSLIYTREPRPSSGRICGEGAC